MAPATKSALDLAKVLRLKRNLQVTVRAALPNIAPVTKSAAESAKVPCVPRIYINISDCQSFVPSRNVTANPAKCCACHAICTSGCRSAAPVAQTQVGEGARLIAPGPRVACLLRRRFPEVHFDRGDMYSPATRAVLPSSRLFDRGPYNSRSRNMPDLTTCKILARCVTFRKHHAGVG